jgi:predicted SnoaL-like aldol condensation-catalyzing enzyme
MRSSPLIAVFLLVCTVDIAGCAGPPPANPPSPTSAERAAQNKATMQRWVDEGHNRGRLEIISEVFSQDYRGHSPGSEPANYQQLVEIERKFHEAFPDVRITTHQIVAEGDWVVTRWTLAGTYKPAGKQVDVTGMTMARFADGKIVEDWQNMDTFGLMKQIDALPKSGK